jgi:Ca2+-dependent lipid-binding protein
MAIDLVDWNETFMIPVTIPLQTDRLSFKLYDYDLVGSNELVSSMTYSIKDIMATGDEGRYRWVNLYGAPLGTDNEFAEAMN